MKKEIENRFKKVEKRIDLLERAVEKPDFTNGKVVVCECGYKWVSGSKLKTVSCPSCASKTLVDKETIKCYKCKKTLYKSDAVLEYNSYFHKKCFKKFNKDSKKELKKVVKEI